MATATEIANDEGKTYNLYLQQQLQEKEDSTKFNYWHVIFLGAIEKTTGHFIWILRSELKIVIDELVKENKILLNNEDIKWVIAIPEEITEEQS